MRHPVVLSSFEEDFRKIGLLPALDETDDPTKPRDVPSPDPDTLGGLDDSEGTPSAKTASAKQPKPKMGPPPDDSDAMDPDEDGGSAGAQKQKSGATKVQGSKEASLRAESSQYVVTAKQPGLRAKGKNKGEKPELALGLKPVKKLAGMKAEGRFSAAAVLIEEVQGLLHSVQIDEEVDQIMRGFRLVAEDAALLADRLTEISDRYKVESLVADMEDLSSDAAEALEAMESEIETLDGGSEEDEATVNSSDVHEGSDKNGLSDPDVDSDEVYDVPSPAFKEQCEAILQVMTSRLMGVLEAYDGAMDHMAQEDESADDAEPEDNRHEIHVHSKAKQLHIHHHSDGDDDGDDDDDGDKKDPHAAGYDKSAAGSDPDADMDDDDDDMHAAADHDDQEGDADQDDASDDKDADSDHDTNSLMARMKALRTRREAMAGGRPFQRGGQ